MAALSSPFPFCGIVGPFLLVVSLLVVQRESSYTVLLLSLAPSWVRASCPRRPSLSAFGAQLPLCLSAAHTGFQWKRASDLIVWGRMCARGLGKESLSLLGPFNVSATLHFHVACRDSRHLAAGETGPILSTSPKKLFQSLFPEVQFHIPWRLTKLHKFRYMQK